MGKENALTKVTALLVDGDTAYRRTVQRFAGEQDLVELCAVTADAKRAWELLAAGLCPQVLVLDTALRDPDAGWLLTRLRRELPDRRPWVLLCSVGELGAETALQALLPPETYYTLVKPYPMPDLFDQIYRGGCHARDLPRYRVHRCLEDICRRLHLGPRLSGVEYLERMVCELVLDDAWQTGTEQLYERITDNDYVTLTGIASAIRRLAEAACARRTPLYAQLCERYGKPADMVLSNTELIWGIGEQVSQRLRL